VRMHACGSTRNTWTMSRRRRGYGEPKLGDGHHGTDQEGREHLHARRRESQAKTQRAQGKAAQAEAGLAEAAAKVAEQQAAAIARALHEDEAYRHADLEEVAEEEAEAVPWSRQAAPGAGMQAAPDRTEQPS